MFHWGHSVSSGVPSIVRRSFFDTVGRQHFFYVLSAFLIFTLGSKVVFADKAVRRNWYRKRFVRILPPYFVLLLVTGVGFVLRHPHDASWIEMFLALLVRLFFLQGVFTTTKDSLAWMDQTWSLSLEVYFYLLFPIAAGAFSSLRGRHLGIVLLALLGIQSGLDALSRSVQVDPHHFGLWYSPSLVAGCLAARFRQKFIHRRRLLALACLPIFLLSFYDPFLMTQGPTGVASSWLTLRCVSGVLLMSLFVRDARSGLIRGLSVLSRASYVLFLFHWPIGTVFDKFLAAKAGISLRDSIPYFAVYLAFCICFSLAFNYVFERFVSSFSGRGQSKVAV